MALSLSENQRKVVESRNTDILVSAAAGSGKTFVLAKRILDIVMESEKETDPKKRVDIDQILVLTYTKKAAGEMKERIAKFINEELANNPNNEFLKRQSVLIHRSFITTIDSFCSTVVKNHFAEINLHPNITIIDDATNIRLKNETLSEMFEDKYALPEDSSDRIEFINAVESVNQAGDDRSLAELIIRIENRADSFPNPDEWLEEAKANFINDASEDFFDKPWMKWLIADGAEAVSEAKYLLESSQRVAKAESLETTERYIKDALISLNNLGVFYAFDMTEAGNNCFKNLMGKDVPSFEAMRAKDAFGKGREELIAELRARRNKAKEIITKHVWPNCFKYSYDQTVKDIEETSLLVSGLVNLTLEFRRRMKEKKERLGVATFGDYSHYALNILLDKDENGCYVPTETAGEYREYFKYVMIDEYQDSNRIQEEMLKAVSGSDMGNHNRFCVGDIKQSIYRFRQACPELILEKMESYTDSAPELRIDLQENYRSRREVLECCNDVFERIMIKSLGGVEYDESQRLNEGNKFYKDAPNMQPEMILADCTGYTGDKFKLQVHMLAKIVKDCHDNMKVSEEKPQIIDGVEQYSLRPVRYGDIAILFRSVSKYSHDLIEIFNSYGIQVDIKDSVSLYEMPEIMALTDYLRILDNPLIDISFLSALKTFAGLTDEEAARIKTGTVAMTSEGCGEQDCTAEATAAENRLTEGKERKTGERQALYILARNCEYPHVRKFIKDFEYIREMAAHLPVAETLAMILNATNYESIVSAGTGGEEALLNIRILEEKAKQFDDTYALGLNSFVADLENAIAADKESGASPAHSVKDAVRIMTMHSSKGLEFPICILADLQKKYQEDELTDNFLIDSELGISARYFNVSTREKRDTLIRSTFARKAKLAGRGEELRILYVAMTRAREKLILAGQFAMDKRQAESGMTPREALLAKYADRLDAEEIPAVDLQENNSMLKCVISGFGKYKNNIRFYSSAELLGDNVEQGFKALGNKEKLIQGAVNGSEAVDIIDKRDVEYSHPELAGLVRKISVSEIKAREIENQRLRHELENMDEGFMGSGVSADKFINKFKLPEVASKYVPSFIEHTEEKITGADVGSATHKLMQCYDFAGDKSVDETLSELVDENVINGDIAKKINLDAVSAFVRSSIGARMGVAAKIDNLFKEIPFFMQVPASKINMGPDTENILIQGIADVLFEEEGKFILLDYKTDRVKASKELVEKYSLQLDLYAEALSKALGKPVAEKYIYSFTLVELIKVK